MDLLAATMAPSFTARLQNGQDKIENSLGDIVMYLLTNAVGVVAAYLSWNCSTMQGLDLLPKVAWAALAYFFGFIYIILFAIRHRNACALPMPMLV